LLDGEPIYFRARNDRNVCEDYGFRVKPVMFDENHQAGLATAYRPSEAR
jgi:hypothetical protein